MTPIDPASPASADPRPPMAPPYFDENPSLALVEEGMDLAEDEAREAASDDYVAEALLNDEMEEALDDIDYTAGEETSGTPEIAALHEEFLFGVDEREDQEESDEEE